MTREELTDTLQKVIGELLYTPYCGFEYRVNQTIRSLPAGWLTPPMLYSVTGVNEGVKRYHVRIALMKMCERSSAQERQKMWGEMEADALQICKILRQEPQVRSVHEMKCTPAEFTMTNKGELSMTLECDVVTMFDQPLKEPLCR